MSRRTKSEHGSFFSIFIFVTISYKINPQNNLKVSNEPANNPYLIGTNLGMSNWHHKRGRGGDETVHWPHLGEWEPIFAVTQVYNSPACLHRK